MQPNTGSTMNAPATPPAPSSDFEALLQRLAEFTRDEQRAVLNRVLRLLIGDRVEREYGLYEPDGTPYLFLVPPDLRAILTTPDRLAELDRRSKNPGKTRPLREIIAELEARQE